MSPALDASIARRGRPLTVVSDHGTAFTSMAILRWSPDRGIDWHDLAPGKPMQNCFIERVNGSSTTLLAGQHHAQRVRQEVGTGKTGR